MLTIPDHLLALVLVVALPLHAGIGYRRFKAHRARQLAQGLPVDNVPEYRSIILTQWGLAAAMTAWWLWQARAWSDIGVALPPDRSLWGSWGFAIIATLTAAAVMLLGMQARTIHRSAEAREKVRSQIASVRDLLPTSRRELQWFTAVSLTAGVCEELLYRGWMIWYFSHMMHPWLAAGLSALIFGVAHLYQGREGVIKTGVVGFIMAVMYMMSGSLWLPMILHAAVDALSGRMTFDALTMDSPQAENATSRDAPSAPRYDQPHASAGPSAA